MKKRLRIEELKEKAAGTASPVVQLDRVQVSRGAGSMSDLIGRAVDMERELEELILQFVRLKDRLIGLIHELDNPLYVEVLYLKYIGEFDRQTGRVKYMTLREIREIVRRSDGGIYSDYHLRDAHIAALNALDEIMENEGY